MAEAAVVADEDGIPRILNKETDPVLVEINQKIEEVLSVYDEEGNKTIDDREFGNVVRAFGCCPNQDELADLIKDVEEDDPSGYFCFEKCQPVLARVLLEKRFRPATEEKLLQAFQVLDKDNKKHLTKEELKELMMNHGDKDAFQEQELDEMLTFAIDPDRGVLTYEEYVKVLLPESEDIHY